MCDAVPCHVSQWVFFLFNQYGGSERKVNVLDMQIYNLNFYKMLSPDLLDMLVG